MAKKEKDKPVLTLDDKEYIIEDMTDEQIVENAMLIINTITSKLPNSEKNLKGFIIKLSMSPPITLSAQEAI